MFDQGYGAVPLNAGQKTIKNTAKLKIEGFLPPKYEKAYFNWCLECAALKRRSKNTTYGVLTADCQ